MAPEEDRGDGDRGPEQQDLEQGEADAVDAEEEPGPGRVERELDQERAERPGRAGEAAAFPDEPGRDRHEAVQHGPDDAEHPARRRQRGPGELVVPRARLEPRAERRDAVAQRQPAEESDPGPPPHASS